jgi:hypothetical protein
MGGGAGGIRTRYLLNANQTFSRVNYGPILTIIFDFIFDGEPLTFPM